MPVFASLSLARLGGGAHPLVPIYLNPRLDILGRTVQRSIYHVVQDAFTEFEYAVRCHGFLGRGGWAVGEA
jgi:hypothetical protein